MINCTTIPHIITINSHKKSISHNILQDLLEETCPNVMKLGLLHEVDTTKTSLGEQLCYVSFEHKSLQELAAALYISQVLDEAENIEVSVIAFRGDFMHFGVADPGFPRGWGCQLSGGCQHTILPNFPKNCMKLKEFGPRGGIHHDPLDPPLFCVLPYNPHDVTTSPCLLVCLNTHIPSKFKLISIT